MGVFYNFPADGDEDAMVMLSDILPTGYECGVLNGRVRGSQGTRSQSWARVQWALPCC